MCFRHEVRIEASKLKVWNLQDLRKTYVGGKLVGRASSCSPTASIVNTQSMKLREGGRG
jgi:hypothetical protein